MNLLDFHPIVSGIIGAAIFVWLAKKWSKRIPKNTSGKGRERLLAEHKITIHIANGLALLGLISGLVTYLSGWLNKHDWRGLGLGLGLMSILPLTYITVVNAMRGIPAIKQCMVAYAISQKTPVIVLFTIMALCGIAGIVSAISLMSQ